VDLFLFDAETPYRVGGILSVVCRASVTVAVADNRLPPRFIASASANAFLSQPFSDVTTWLEEVYYSTACV
jgi:hypothetical protein